MTFFVTDEAQLDASGIDFSAPAIVQSEAVKSVAVSVHADSGVQVHVLQARVSVPVVPAVLSFG